MICFKIVLQNYELFFSKQVISVEKYIFLKKMYFESNIMKKILGLDLGTNSIGWALVNESENNDEKSSIVKPYMLPLLLYTTLLLEKKKCGLPSLTLTN